MFGEQIVTRATFTRPLNKTDYTVGDVISNSTSATNLLAFNANSDTGGTGYITKIQLKTNNPLFISQCRLWLFKTSTYSVAVDNAALNVTFAGDEIGFIDIPVMQAVGTACAMAEWTGTFAYQTALSSGSTSTMRIYGVLQLMTGTTTPTDGQQLSVELTCERN